MALETNFNVAPYFDDFDANSNFYRVLFKPSVAVQARELTQMQSIMQDQIDKFGRHVFKDGSVVEGCTLNFDDKYAYIKINDQFSNGAVVNVSDYQGYKLVSSSNLQAQIVNYATGLESNNPDLNTFYISYLNSTVYANNSPQKTFDPGDLLSIKTPDDVLVANVTVAASTYDPVGTGYATSISEGTIFKKGFFIRVEPHTLVVSKYDSTPGDVIVGFVTNESIISADSDASLYDNAIGSPNYTAPGANRLKLTANLVYRTADNTDVTSVTSNTSNFFTLATFNGGKPVVTYTDPQYNILQEQIARRTFEESGDYIVDPFELSTAANTSNTNAVVLEVDRGIGYIRGYRVEFINKNRIDVRKGTDTLTFPNQITTTTYGNYVVVNEFCGSFDTKNLATVSLYATASAHVTAGDYESAGAPTTQIGTARIRDIQYVSGTPGTPSAQYRMYLFDIKITAGGYSFADVRSVYSSSPKAYADPVLNTAGDAVIEDSSIGNLVFPLGAAAVQTINTTATSFVYRSSSNASFSSSNGSATVTLGSDQFNVSGSLSESNEARFVVVAVSNGQSANLTGTIVANTSTANVIGAGGNLLSNFVAGDYVKYYYNATQSEVRRIVSVTNATFMVVNSAPTNGNAAASFARFIPKGSTISFERNDAAYINVTSSTSATFQLGFTPTANIDAFAYYDVYRGSAVAASKAINKSKYVKIQANTHPAGVRGPWCLGLPDVNKIKAVYQGTTFANTNTNALTNFVLDTGQRDGYYDLAYLYAKPGVTLGTNDVLLVELDYFTYSTGAGVGYFSINSYPIDDANTSNTSAIVTAEIPLYTSKDGRVYDLRDSIDFRPVATASVANTDYSNASYINPSSTLSLSSGSGSYTPAPDSNFITAFTYYIPRKDKVVLSPQGKLTVVEGNPSTIPNAPRDIDGSMTLGTLTIPPYPSLSQDEVRTYGRSDYGISIDLQQNRRYTMRDIGVMDKKFNRLEYYTSLNLLEASAKTLVIKDDTGAERFKNGFIVDPFRGFTIADTQSQEFKAAIDIKQQELAPKIKRTYIDLDYDSANSTNVTKTGNLITLSGTDVSYIQQPFSSKFRNCVENIIYVWNGNITLTPDGDAQPDVDVSPDVVASVDLSGITDLVNSLENIIGEERIVGSSTNRDTTITETPWTGGPRTRTISTTDTTTFNTIRTDLDVSATTINNSFDFGELVQDVSIQKFIRPRRIQFQATGVKPNTRVYPFFDGIAASSYCTPTDSTYTVVAANKGSALTADSNGNVYGVFDVPADTFKTGERVFRLVDVDNLTTGVDAITTQAAATYSASNIAITKARYKLDTKTPQIAINSIEVVNSFTTATTTSSSQLFDPIAQTFLINEPSDVPGVFIGKIDLFFRTKHPTLGVEVQVREVDNGFPTLNIVPYGRKVLTAAEVNTSTDASTATTFTFDSPLFLKSGREYAFVVMPVGSNDGYTIWVGEIGGTDVTTNTPIYDNNSTGVMFTSSTNRIWTPFQKEDIKFAIYRKDFTSSSGTISFKNSNTEFFTVQSAYSNFIAGEKIAASNGTLTYTANTWCNTTSNTITVDASVANAQTAFTANTVILISSNNKVYTDVRQIISIPTAGTIVVNAVPTFSDNAASLGKMSANGALFGYASRINTDNGILHLYNSSANAGINFAGIASGNNILLVGLESRARANLVSVDNIIYSTVNPQFSYVVPPGGTAGIGMRGMSNTSNLDSSYTYMNADMETFFTDKERIVKSYSNEIADGTSKSMYVSAPIGTYNSKISPMFDNIKTSMLVIQNQVSNTLSLTNEYTPSGGNTQAKYISKTVVLAEGQDAEDIQVYLSAYKPSNTDISVYVKYLNAADSQTFDQKSWSLLNQNTASSVVSSRANRNDFKEFLYDVPYKAAPSASNTSTLSYFSNGTFTNNITSSAIFITAANSTFNTGDLVYYVGNAVSGIANGYFSILTSNTTAVTLANTGSTSTIAISNAAGANGTLFLIPQTAFRSLTDANTVSYFSNTGGLFHGYKTFALKIVMTGNEGTHLVPRVSDMRAIALQA